MPTTATRAPKRRASTHAQKGPAPLLETITSVQARLSLGRTSVYRLIGEGKLRTVKLSARAVRVVSADVEALVQRAV